MNTLALCTQLSKAGANGWSESNDWERLRQCDVGRLLALRDGLGTSPFFVLDSPAQQALGKLANVGKLFGTAFGAAEKEADKVVDVSSDGDVSAAVVEDAGLQEAKADFFPREHAGAVPAVFFMTEPHP